MDVRQFLAQAEALGWVNHVSSPVSTYLEMAGLCNALGEPLTLYECVTGWPYRTVNGLFGRRRNLALALGVQEADLISALVSALRNPTPPKSVLEGPCQEEVIESPDLNDLPILTHFAADGGPYVTSGVLIVNDPQVGPNAAYHRLMQTGPHAFTARLVEGRGTHTAWLRSEGDLPAVACLGAPLQVQLAAAMSPAPGVDELAIANALASLTVIKAVGSDLMIPAGTEIVLEGRLTKDLADEGSFVDLTRTRDIVRQQPRFVVDRVTHRRDPIYQALLPGGAEHKLLMGLPREPTIYDAVSQVCTCRGVVLTQGGGHWLHAVVQIAKASPDDGRKAIEAAFRGHTSLKHVVIVDEDVDPSEMDKVEWAIATRFQADRNLMVFEDQPSSSLDPSATQVPGQKARTTKVGVDATMPWGPEGPDRGAYQVVPYGDVDLASHTIRRGAHA